MYRNTTRRRHKRLSGACLLTVALVVAGCSGDRLLGQPDQRASAGGASPSPTFEQRISGLFGNRPEQPQAQASSGANTLPEDFECPTVTIRPGTSTFAVSAAGADPSAMSLRYQATFGQMARECGRAGNMLTMKVGVEGRVILGPAGGPGQVEMPLRYAVVREGPEPKTIVSKLRWVTVEIPPGESNVPFTQVEDELSFPMPREHELEAYVVYVGFDRAAVKEPAKKKPVKPPRRPARRAN